MRLFGRHPLQLVIAVATFVVGIYSIEIAVQLAMQHKAGANALSAFGLGCYAVTIGLLWWKPAKSN